METKTSISKLGILCLVVAIAMMALVNLSILIVLGFLYYSYKLLYKKDKPSFNDKILIIALFVLFLIEIILSFYFIANYNTANYTASNLLT